MAFSIALSAHLGMSGNFNSVHPTITYEKNTVISGIFYNSESRPSLFLAQSREYKKYTIATGIVTGYSGSDILPMIKINRGKFFVTPGYANGDAGMVVGYEFKF